MPRIAQLPNISRFMRTSENEPSVFLGNRPPRVKLIYNDKVKKKDLVAMTTILIFKTNEMELWKICKILLLI